MLRRRVVVTGMGALSAAGRGVDRFWNACVEGRSALGSATRFETGDLGSPRIGEIDAALLASLVAEARHAEPAAALALAAAREALSEAGFEGQVPPRAAGVVLGTCLGGALARFDALAPGAGRESGGSGSFSAPAALLAERLALEGPVLTLSTACASGTAALAQATRSVRRGEAEVVLAGGVDVLSRFVVTGFSLLRALASGEVRPFDRRRDGLALGEGAAILVLEEREHAVRRGAQPLAEILGWGSAGDAHHMTGPSPDGDGVVRAVLAALEDATLPPAAVEFISAHGTGTVFNDRMETIAIKRVFGPAAYRIPVDSVKPIVGHTLGAAGALEAIVCVRALRLGIVPPTLHYAELDPECDLDYVPNVARRVQPRCALSTSSAFAGNNAALLFGAA